MSGPMAAEDVSVGCRGAGTQLGHQIQAVSVPEKQTVIPI